MKIALVGNPNTGKSSIFNMLTGLRQHVGNFPGVTVDVKTGEMRLGDTSVSLVDLPGTYSIYPRSADERVVYESLNVKTKEDRPDAVMVVLDTSNLQRNLLLASQVYDLGLPTLFVLNMNDVAKRRGIKVNEEGLKSYFPEAEIVSANARAGMGKSTILEALQDLPARSARANEPCEINDFPGQEKETIRRYKEIKKMISAVETVVTKQDFTSKWDRILTHPIFGYAIFASILLIIFQFIFAFANYPMDLIDGAFASFSSWTANMLPAGVFTDLLTEGVIPGIGGVVIFIPQIALLFFFIAILEETGYLARVVFIMDRLMRPLGLNGKSVVPMMSSVACAIPGVMATRTIADRKERLITILIAPLMSCSARIPVYTLLISLVIPETKVWGIINAQGLVLFGLYFLGTAMALIVALILKVLIKTDEKGFLLLELPGYKAPRWGNVGLIVLEKVRVFVWDAGRIILAISIVLWALASYGPSERIQMAENQAKMTAAREGMGKAETDQLIASAKLENSYIGIMGKGIEPAIEPLGYDWKIGISLITSFAAREVFVGSMATIYAVEDDGEEQTPLIEQLRKEKRSDGTPVYSLATGVSLMVFYAFAMMCMATLAVVKRETKSWKWPLVQLGYMGALAYFGALITYQLLA
ncbi:MAG: ferrous iron transporter B [bacterium]|nr:ferrous iron transporter B [bacterium]